MFWSPAESASASQDDHTVVLAPQRQVPQPMGGALRPRHTHRSVRIAMKLGLSTVMMPLPKRAACSVPCSLFNPSGHPSLSPPVLCRPLCHDHHCPTAHGQAGLCSALQRGPCGMRQPAYGRGVCPCMVPPPASCVMYISSHV